MTSNVTRSVLYTGVTSDLYTRMTFHRALIKGFTKQYRATALVYYKFFPFIEEAIAEEKRIKAGSRKAKNKLVNRMNPEWRDLFPDIEQW